MGSDLKKSSKSEKKGESIVGVEREKSKQKTHKTDHKLSKRKKGNVANPPRKLSYRIINNRP